MVDWDRAAAMTRGKVSEVFDTFRLRLKPMRKSVNVNAKAIEDLDRTAFEFRALMDLGPSQDVIPRHLPADVGVRGTMVSYDAVVTALTDLWPWAAKTGDRMIVLESKGMILAGSEWEIMAGEDDGSPRQAFYLNRRKD